MVEKPYTLTLFSERKPDHPASIFTSVQMIGYCLWREFSQLPHVRLQYFESSSPETIPETDFALIHDYFQSSIYRRLPEIRSKTAHRIMGVMESAFDSELIDRTFTFLPIPRLTAQQIRLPCPKALLMEHAAEKEVGTILLDHPWQERGVQTDISPFLWNWLLPGHCLAQLARTGHEAGSCPCTVWRIPETNYLDYLEATKSFETFILTHPGSYEHSIIDMAARGIRVLVPARDGRPFCHPSIADDLQLPTFSCRDELMELLASPRPLPASDRFTDMPQVAAAIDAYCQGVL